MDSQILRTIVVICEVVHSAGHNWNVVLRVCRTITIKQPTNRVSIIILEGQAKSSGCRIPICVGDGNHEPQMRSGIGSIRSSVVRSHRECLIDRRGCARSRDHASKIDAFAGFEVNHIFSLSDRSGGHVCRLCRQGRCSSRCRENHDESHDNHAYFFNNLFHYISLLLLIQKLLLVIISLYFAKFKFATSSIKKLVTCYIIKQAE